VKRIAGRSRRFESVSAANPQQARVTGDGPRQAAILNHLEAEAVRIRAAVREGGRCLHRLDERWIAHSRLDKVLFPDEQIVGRREQACGPDDPTGVLVRRQMETVFVLVITRCAAGERRSRKGRPCRTRSRLGVESVGATVDTDTDSHRRRLMKRLTCRWPTAVRTATER
jgi:hypothetical protein